MSGPQALPEEQEPLANFAANVRVELRLGMRLDGEQGFIPALPGDPCTTECSRGRRDGP